MDASRGVVYGVVAVVVGAAVLSGPLVGGVDLSREQDMQNINPTNGTVDLTVKEFDEDGLRIEAGRYGSGEYYLVAPDVLVNVTAVEGQPLLNYKVVVPELAASKIQVHFLGEDTVGELVLTMPRTAISSDAKNYDEVAGTVLLVVRSNAGERVVFSRNVTIEVVK